MRGWRADVSFGHGSRALPIASRLLGVPTATMYDYEWVNPAVFNICCRAILLPEAIDLQRCREAGINGARVRHYPGYKEHLYLAGPIGGADLMNELGLVEPAVNVLVRPPATAAHYHNPDAERILAEVLRRLERESSVQVVYLARSRDQLAFLDGHSLPRLLVPKKVYDGPTLISCMDLVIGGGGTMTREAAILGVPSYSFFRGRTGRVDESLESSGSLVMLRRPDDIAEKLRIAKRKPSPTTRDNSALVRTIVEHIKEVAR
jgi:predicted glycosyltransferase